MDIVEQAFKGLFPERVYNYRAKIRYSAAFKDYNANIRYNSSKREIVLSMSEKWKDVSEDIRMGLIQELLMKMFNKGEKRNTLCMDLYHIYMQNTHISADKENVDPYLLESFNRVNDEYFDGMIELTNLVWGEKSLRTLGRYEYGSDTIMISSIFKDAPIEYLDKVMHHEMLHKKHKFKMKNGRCHHHTPEFREEERQFKDFDRIEAETSSFVNSLRRSTRRRNVKKRTRKSIIGWLNGF